MFLKEQFVGFKTIAPSGEAAECNWIGQGALKKPGQTCTSVSVYSKSVLQQNYRLSLKKQEEYVKNLTWQGSSSSRHFKSLTSLKPETVLIGSESRKGRKKNTLRSKSNHKESRGLCITCLWHYFTPTADGGRDVDESTMSILDSLMAYLLKFLINLVPNS